MVAVFAADAGLQCRICRIFAVERPIVRLVEIVIGEGLAGRCPKKVNISTKKIRSFEKLAYLCIGIIAWIMYAVVSYRISEVLRMRGVMKEKC